ncbi:ribosomal protein subunit L35 [Schizosaccharomyces cryophilus OY26]|uniref:Ribosomal protein subunit L35 n=1 Tax=Schizosaccharomyces cryophilus (strain OY26 / ATCC MYA-4695 / CBS 11777 / NBRC 106824 / NRRL Y48691) TaxID=653667 RepID=S9XH12_SCHCR|nr:ribosomal protein subunit L35 [Schizosaccharomyces cryophilus OY26]EPY52961.1 ribosomal protein subunit L35 [Schizosaccharomyces cryophilus OY26]
MQRVWTFKNAVPRVLPIRNIYKKAQDDAYRLATVVVEEYSEKKRKELEQALASSAGKETARISMLRVLSEINLPSVRSKFYDGEYDFSRPAFLHLLKQKWESHDKLLLLQRLEQMKVIKDLGLGSFNPIVDVRLSFSKDESTNVVPGSILPTEQTCSEPLLQILPFSTEEHNYTIATLDLDVPNYETNQFQTSCLWLASNIPVKATDRLAIRPSNCLIPYTPPTMHKGEDKHRIVTLVMQQRDPSVELDLSKIQKENVNIRDICTQYSLQPVGSHLFRSQYDDCTEKLLSEHPNVENYTPFELDQGPYYILPSTCCI